MAKAKSLLEKVWWVIPPVVVVFGIPLYDTLAEMIDYSLPAGSFAWVYIKNFLTMMDDLLSFGGILAIFLFGFIALGYYLARNKSILLRVALPILLGRTYWILRGDYRAIHNSRPNKGYLARIKR